MNFFLSSYEDAKNLIQNSTQHNLLQSPCTRLQDIGPKLHIQARHTLYPSPLTIKGIVETVITTTIIRYHQGPLEG